jgi:hypothetical protein
MDKESALIRPALAIALERQGGELTYTEAEYGAIARARARARQGEVSISGEVDRSVPGAPVVRVKLIPSTSKESMPVS